MKKTNYYGFDTIDEATIEDSLRKHRLIVQNFKSDLYYCLYEDRGSYEYCFLCESDIKDLLNSKSWLTKTDLNKFFNDIEIEKSVFMKLPFIYQIKSLMEYFKTEDIMCKKTHYMTFDEAMSEYWSQKF